MNFLKYALIIICTIALFSIANAQFTTEINPQLVTKVWDAKWIQHPNNSDQFGIYHFRKSFDVCKWQADLHWFCQGRCATLAI